MENTSAINPNETNSMANNNAWINGKIAQDAAVADVGQNADYGVRRGQHFLFNETISVCIPWQPTTVGINLIPDSLSFLALLWAPLGRASRDASNRMTLKRGTIANDFIQATEYRIPLLIDPVSKTNPFSEVYCPWPIRFYVIDHMKKLSYIAEPIEGSFPLELIRNAFDDAIQQCQ
ncbi:unnamed protein product [Rotaria socialis]